MKQSLQQLQYGTVLRAVACLLAANVARAQAVTADGQQPERSEARAVTQAVAAHVRRELTVALSELSIPTGRVGLDIRTPPADPHEFRGGSRRLRERSAELAGWISAELVDGDTTRVCADVRPRSCRLKGVTTLVRVGEPAITADTARVTVTFVHHTGLRRVPLQTRVQHVVVRRVGGVWKVDPRSVQESVS